MSVVLRKVKMLLCLQYSMHDLNLTANDKKGHLIQITRTRNYSSYLSLFLSKIVLGTTPLVKLWLLIYQPLRLVENIKGSILYYIYSYLSNNT